MSAAVDTVDNNGDYTGAITALERDGAVYIENFLGAAVLAQFNREVDELMAREQSARQGFPNEAIAGFFGDRVDHMSCPKRLRLIAAFSHGIGRDYHRRARYSRPLQGDHANPSQPHYHAGSAWLHCGGIENRANTGLQGAINFGKCHFLGRATDGLHLGDQHVG